jgi:hypothetical protein
MMPSRSQFSHFHDGRVIATAERHFEHKSCAVKFHAYTLDNYYEVASALQQNMLFPHFSGIALCWRPEHDKGCAPAHTPLHQPLISSN